MVFGISEYAILLIFLLDHWYLELKLSLVILQSKFINNSLELEANFLNEDNTALISE